MSPLTGKWRMQTTGINVPVVIAGVAVNPGNLVLADEVGVCFVPFVRAAEVLALAQSIGESGERRLKTLEAGISLVEFAGLKARA